MADVQVDVAGVGIHPFGRFETSITEMGVAAVRAALTSPVEAAA